MSGDGDDATHTDRFVGLFERLKGCCEDDADGLAHLATTQANVKDICSDIIFAGLPIEMEKFGRPACFSEVSRAFLDAWRDYENRYQSVVVGILFGELGHETDADAALLDQQWEEADNKARRKAHNLERVIEFAELHLERDGSDERLSDGVRVWNDLERKIGFDPRGMFRRRALIEHVFIPRDVADEHRSADELSPTEVPTTGA